jgi:Skp family chaperone for outer membrane proteins
MPRPKGSKNRKTRIIEDVDAKIAAAQAEITRLSAELKARKTELRALNRAKQNADKAAAERRAEEDRKAILAAAERSGKTVDEILGLLGQ